MPLTKRYRDETHELAEILDSTCDVVRPIVLDVQDCTSFSVEFKLLVDGSHTYSDERDHNFLIGLVPRDVSDKCFIMKEGGGGAYPEYGYFIDDWFNYLSQDGQREERVLANEGTVGMDVGQTVTMMLQHVPQAERAQGDPSAPVVRFVLSSSSEEGRRPMYTQKLPIADYVPCVVLRQAGYKVQCKVIESSKRRTQDTLAAMWNAKNFTDAEIVCDGRIFPVHRDVMATASPFFAAAFVSQMREAQTARVEVGDASAVAVEALVKYVYTKRLEASDALAVLPLAHRYQIHQLVVECAQEILRTVSVGSVAKVVATLGALRDDAVVAKYWSQIMHRLMTNEGLLRATIEPLV